MLKKGYTKKILGIASLALLTMTLVFAVLAKAADAEVQKIKKLDIEQLFNGKEGTFVLKNVKNDNMYIYNNEEAQNRLRQNQRLKCLIL